MKKTIIIISAVLVLCAPAAADFTPLISHVDILGACSGISSDEIIALKSGKLGDTALYAAALNLNFVFLFDYNDDLYALFIKKDQLYFNADNTAEYPGYDGYSVRANEKWSLHYLGFGVRKYVFTDGPESRQVMPYVGIDAGMYFSLSGNSDIYITDESGNPAASGSIIAGGEAVFGFSGEAGADYWLYEDIGLAVRCGYRVCSGDITSMRVNDGYDEDLKNAGILNYLDPSLNMSSFYLQAGITFKFQDYRP